MRQALLGALRIPARPASGNARALGTGIDYSFTEMCVPRFHNSGSPHEQVFLHGVFRMGSLWRDLT